MVFCAHVNVDQYHPPLTLTGPTPQQVMVNSTSSGVAFSRHPLKPLTADCVLVEAVYGLGEGLVGGDLVADRYQVRQGTFEGKGGGWREEGRGGTLLCISSTPTTPPSLTATVVCM